ncbi:bifunctional phosphoribosyl-AMP cyclohydrolase/phosphoribosyl-ATP diphosphatase HisIE [Thermus sp.]|uniref:bifunctional phosphoribosyl-AMP cyclohydrolase/phosphoribosyl-ATP diphosphatase HisIE n=1 Tax=Thermus sp. TaxID=275 RepID=UPI003D12DF6C
MDLSAVRFDEKGLVPVVVQDARTGEVLTLAYANREALEETLRTRRSTFYSRSRQALWRKGETSGHTQEVVEVLLDCDGDAVVYRVLPQGPACHTGERTCFHRALLEGEKDLGFVAGQVYATILERLRTLPEGSYVARMHQAGLDRILKKIGEEAGEVILAAKNESPEELRHEAADLLFHLLLTLAELGLTPEDLARTLWERHKPKGLAPAKEPEPPA